MRRDASALLAIIVCACSEERAAGGPGEPISPIALPDARLEHADGTEGELDPGRPYLLHFWATWCAPCRTELPALLAAAEETAGDRAVIAVSMDGSWSPVRGFFGGTVPASVVREHEGALAQELGVASLPDTYVIDGRGSATHRIHGALDWHGESTRRWLRQALSR